MENTTCVVVSQILSHRLTKHQLLYSTWPALTSTPSTDIQTQFGVPHKAGGRRGEGWNYTTTPRQCDGGARTRPFDVDRESPADRGRETTVARTVLSSQGREEVRGWTTRDDSWKNRVNRPILCSEPNAPLAVMRYINAGHTWLAKNNCKRLISTARSLQNYCILASWVHAVCFNCGVKSLVKNIPLMKPDQFSKTGAEEAFGEGQSRGLSAPCGRERYQIDDFTTHKKVMRIDWIQWWRGRFSSTDLTFRSCSEWEANAFHPLDPSQPLSIATSKCQELALTG